MTRPDLHTAVDAPKHCVRGCTRPNIDKETGKVGEPIPRIATDGLLCKKDAENLAHWLSEIVDLYATLDVRIERAAEREGGGKRGKISGSPALVRLDVLALMDPRTNPGDGRPGPDGKREPDDGLVNVPQTISSWAELLAVEQRMSMCDVDSYTEIDDEDNEITIYTYSAKPMDLSTATNLLAAWLPTVLEQMWIDEFYDEIHSVHSLLDRLLGIPKPKILGHCLSIIGEGKINTRPCGQVLYAPAGTAVIRCSNCGRTYNGIDIVRLRAIEMHENGDTVALKKETA